MKAQFLKIAKVKTEKQFYAKYPTEEAFFKAHPEAKKSIKKAQIGAYIGGDSTANAKPLSYQQYYDDLDKQLTGTTERERLDMAAKQAQIAAASKPSGGGGMDMSSMMSMFGGGEGGEGGSLGEEIMSSGGFGAIGGGIGGARYGKHVHKAQVGIMQGPEQAPSSDYYQNNNPYFTTNPGATGLNNPAVAAPQKSPFDITKALPLVGPVAGAINAFGEQEKQKNATKQAMLLSGLSLDLSRMPSEETERRYVQPKDNIIQPGQLSRARGVGTNPLTRNGGAIRRAQDGTVENPQIDAPPTDWYEEGMDKDTYYALKQQLDDAGYTPIARPESVNVRDMQAITEEQPDPNQMSDEQAASFMEMYNRDQGKSTATFDSKSARDNWVQKTGLPWSEAKRLGYTDGSAKDNNKLLNELRDPRFKKENLRTEAPKKSSQARTPVQHRDTPTGKLAPIKKPLTIEEYWKSKGIPTFNKNQGEIRMPDEGTMIDRVGERLGNPLQTLANLAKYGELPASGFSKNNKNAYDQVIGVANPFYWANAVGNAADYTEQGEYKKAAIEAADALPALGKLKYTKYIPFNKGLPPASVRRAGYLGEGAKRLKAAPAKQLPAAKPKMLKQPFTPNFVMYKDGGEIQNTYAPGYLYDNLGYEPLDDSNVKQYAVGGAVAGNIAGNYVGSQFNNNAGYQAGAALGGFSDFIVPGSSAIVSPVLGTIGGALDQAFGDAGKIKKYQEKAKRNTENAVMNNMAPGIHSQHGGHMEDGGYVNPNYNPQVITMFGDHTAQDFADYAHQYRAGGHLKSYTPPSDRAMEQYAMGGEVQTTWGGHAETISHNPYMPGSGETIMFRGKSHDESDGNGNTGIGVKYGKGNHDSYTNYAEYGTQEADADVEVERGEPAAELIDPKTGEKNLTIWGDLSTNMFVDILGKEAKNKKFKTLVDKEWTKQEIKGGELVNQAAEIANKKDANPLDFSTAQALDFAGKSILKNIAQKKMDAAYLQNAINETAEENGLVASDLARGKVKVNKEALQEYAEYGKTIKKAKDGVTTDDKGKKITKAERDRLLKSGEYKVDPSDPNKIRRVKSKDATSEQKKSASALGYIPKGQSVDPTTGLSTKITQKQFEEFKENNKWYDWSKFDAKDPNAVNDAANKFNKRAEEIGSDARILPDKDGKVTIVGQQFISGKLEESKKETPGATESDYLEVEDEDKVYPVEAQKRNPWVDAAGQILPFFRPTDQEAFDQSQIYPEMAALSSNQLEPVQAQSYQPDLLNTYDISLQDQLNANQADFNSIKRLYANNPFALAQFAAQKYAANEKVLGEQFRQNQAMDMGIYNANTQTLNDAKLKNLDIFDRQYGRQEQAKTNTKAVRQAALNSIADKYAKNRLENRELGIYENLYNYRYDPSGRAINMNAPWQANLPNMYDKGNKNANMRAVYDNQGNFLRYEPIEETKTTTDKTTTTPIPSGSTGPIVAQKNGGKVKAKNGSIVSAYKNL